jgi:sulfoxide reductase heme-binding subunit YedZ
VRLDRARGTIRLAPDAALDLGALALDLVAVLVVTSLLRRRLPYRLWRAIHWAAYAACPLAVAHGVGAGSDAGTEWLRAVNAMCVAAVDAALVWRVLALEEPAPPPRQPFTDDSQVRLAR